VLLSLLSPEAQLLFLSATDSAKDSEIRELLKRKLDWPDVCRLANREQAAPLVWRRIETAAPREIPPAADAHLRKLARVTSFHMAYLEQLVLDSTASLNRAGIDYVLLKGAALAFTAYGSFAERPMVDADLLVREKDASAAVEALLSAGWAWRADKAPDGDFSHLHELPPLIDQNGLLSAEVHTSLLPASAPFGITTDAVLRSAQMIRLNHSTIKVPDACYLLLHACVHFAWFHFFRTGAFRTFRDVQTIISKCNLDWTSFVELARSHRADTCCFWTLHLARELTGATIPDDVLAALRPPVPAVMLRALERHFTLTLMPSGTLCPSVSVRRVMWNAGILPHRSRHGTSRPWKASPLPPEEQAARERHRAALERRWDVRRTANARRSGRHWARYWASVLLAAPAYR
jgi:hypothetical protein